MFEYEIKELFKYYTKQELKSEMQVIETKRNEPAYYDFDTFKYVLIPENYKFNIESLNELKEDYTYIMFINIKVLVDDQDKSVRRLTHKDETAFEEFLNACSKSDKDEGMVSLEDNDVYGAFINGKLASVSSTWYWGEVLADIGVLTHPKYRKRRLASKTVRKLMSDVDRTFIWRCDSRNEVSFNLGTQIGFIPTGKVFEFKKVE